MASAVWPGLKLATPGRGTMFSGLVLTEEPVEAVAVPTTASALVEALRAVAVTAAAAALVDGVEGVTACSVLATAVPTGALVVDVPAAGAPAVETYTSFNDEGRCVLRGSISITT